MSENTGGLREQNDFVTEMTESELLNHASCILAIDPGLSGAVCRLGRGNLTVRRDFKNRSDIADAIFILSRSGISHAVMELVHAMPGQGVCSMFSFGRAAGVADGALVLALPNMTVEEISPQKWQNFFRAYFEIDRKTEFNSRDLASQLFPSSEDLFKRVKDHNTADAVLMAAYTLMRDP